jgi:hypothetical protein
MGKIFFRVLKVIVERSRIRIRTKCRRFPTLDYRTELDLKLSQNGSHTRRTIRYQCFGAVSAFDRIRAGMAPAQGELNGTGTPLEG